MILPVLRRLWEYRSDASSSEIKCHSVETKATCWDES